MSWKYRTRSPHRSETDTSEEFSHRKVYGASFETLERLCFREWPSIDSVGDIPPGEKKSAIFLFGSRHEFGSIDMGHGEMTIPVSE